MLPPMCLHIVTSRTFYLIVNLWMERPKRNKANDVIANKISSSVGSTVKPKYELLIKSTMYVSGLTYPNILIINGA